MPKTSVFLAIAFILFGVLRAQALPLAKDGQALQPIIISEKASDQTQAVATELQKYLNQITGAQFKVEKGDGKTGSATSGIVLGTLEEFPHPELQKPLELRDRFDGVEAFAIRSEANRVLLMGRTDLAVSHAAFRFLEELGYRHFFPAKEWEVVPTIPDLKVDINLEDRPKILSRNIWFGYGYFRPKERPVQDYESWQRHNRMARSVNIDGGHSWQKIIRANQEEFDKHPEYYAMVDGKRPISQKLELGNPAVRKMVVDYALDFFRQNPDADMVSLDPSDGLGFSESPESKKLGSVSDAVFGIVNEAARAVQKEFPGKLVGSLAYSEYSAPPSFALEPNVYVQLTNGFNYGEYSFTQLIEMWPKKAKRMGYYDYYSVWLWDGDMLPGGRAGDASYLAHSIANFYKHNGIGISAESGNNWGPHGRGYFLASKLMWNPNADADAVLDDFYAKAFGPAAAPMKRFYERFDTNSYADKSKPRVSEHLYAMGLRDVQEATQKAAGHPEVLARLDHLKIYLHYVHLRWLFNHAKDNAEKKELFLRAMSWVNRTRFTYMNHWRAMQNGWEKQARSNGIIDEPTWWAGNPAPKPWDARADEPPSREEIDANFAKALEYFQPNPPGEQIDFSNDLVPINWKDADDRDTAMSWRSAASYALYSVAGEPLKFGIVGGILKIYHDKPTPVVTITDAQGMEIKKLSISHDSKRHDYEIKVPAPGLYFLDIINTKASWGFYKDAGTIATLKLDPNNLLSNGGSFLPHYFYVPKGTKEIRYYWSGRFHVLINPDGEKLGEERIPVEKNYAFKVPPGMDGKVWAIGGPSVRVARLWFYNVPNFVASTKSALMVPREVAEADGLTIRTPRDVVKANSPN